MDEYIIVNNDNSVTSKYNVTWKHIKKYIKRPSYPQYSNG